MTDPREPKVIKRYTNRKLYDTVESRYVTLDEIAEMVKQGVEVKIVDNRTKEDLTSVTLAQIVFEEEKKTSRMPLSLLREIIRRPQEQISGFFKTEVTPRVEKIREEAESRLGGLFRKDDGSPADAPEAEARPETKADGLHAADLVKASQKAFEDFQKKADERVKQVVENVLGGLPALGRDLGTLVQRIEQLEKKIEQLENKK
ncbi:MAG: polyhydroxyalkanoate synthesis regulator DNA-binding domain-containing protein [Myxococcaceae bacterium]